MNRRNLMKLMLGSAGLMMTPLSFAVESLKRKELFVPPILEPSSNGTFVLNFQYGHKYFIAGKATKTLGFNGNYLGPVIRAKQGQDIKLNVNNNLKEDVTLHWHGLIIPGSLDGGPHQIIKPSKTWKVSLPIKQEASTCWYHPHIYPKTSELVAKGLAGLFIIEDKNSDTLPLPKAWGIDDIPIIIQDRKFNDDGSFNYKLLDIPTVSTGYVGDKVLVNGDIYPEKEVPSGWIRFRVLNGSNARSYNVTISDKRAFYVIASDGGFLNSPVKVTELPILAGERYEILISTKDKKSFDLMSLPFNQMGMTMAPFNKPYSIMSFIVNSNKAPGKLPQTLNSIPPININSVKKNRMLTLGMDERLDSQAMMLMNKKMEPMKGMKIADSPSENTMHKKSIMSNTQWLTQEELKVANSINGRSFTMDHIEFTAKKGDYELWTISTGKDTMLHPFHAHGCQFRVISLNNESIPPYLTGWKDTVVVKGKTQILVKFSELADKNAPYMAHCHILEHEDTGMMTQFCVR
ncbi:multicopper oxidase CueO (plasmid) [Vibrio sp. SS-MA-C1-2]|uniref:multicopper oxidase CueO n=1 Tax=Vibrio sp. SS-MA-C1-2 TaxID=2908646 RepID=UPI001F195C80|nr:multicopper oxidase CueO [Vibrio sp. SS-MA-C1-2]UJF20194.1 multicopper oxidase CueO [Vibrio sp. SS-MA-C1-2]